VIPRDGRVLEHGRPDEVLGAVAGVPLSAEDLRITLTGCWLADADVRATRQFSADWRVVDVRPNDVLTLHKEPPSGEWRLVAADHRDEHGGRRWLAEYRDFHDHLPRAVRLASASPSPGGTYDLQLTLSQVETDVPLDAEAFRVKIPSGATPISLDELRRARPGVREN
jgi:hypothetical protein